MDWKAKREKVAGLSSLEVKVVVLVPLLLQKYSQEEEEEEL